jgi:membrane-bound lytic murein transglycosylase MltF
MRFGILILVAAVAGGCGQATEEAKPATAAPEAAAPHSAPSPPTDPPEEELPPPAWEAALPEDMRSIVHQTFTGDFKEMTKRRLIRVGVPFNRTHYFVDKGVQRGLAYEYLTLYEDTLNKRLKTGNLKIHVVPLPIPRDALLPSLQKGTVDLVVAQLTVTPERQKIVDFTTPTRPNIDEVVVTGPDAPPVATVDDLSGQEVFVRRTSSYYDSLEALNKRLRSENKAPVNIEIASENLEDDDLLEMVNSGLIPAIVVDNYLAEFWKKVLPGLTIHDTVKLRTGGNLAVAIRKKSPELAAELNTFIKNHGLNSAIGRTLDKRYLQNTKYVNNARSEEERKKFLALIDLFRKYGDQYKFDYLMMAAQGYQESRLDQNAKSHVGAIGVMQLMPATGKEQNVGDVHQIEPNIHAGVKYMRFVRNQFFEDQPMDDLNKSLFTFASYNAGPGRIRQLRREAQKQGLNPNVWFGNVEQIASERIGRETVTYVSNIYKYYVAYKLVESERDRRNAAKDTLKKSN